MEASNNSNEIIIVKIKKSTILKREMLFFVGTVVAFGLAIIEITIIKNSDIWIALFLIGGCMLSAFIITAIANIRWRIILENGIIIYKPGLGKNKYFHEEELNYIKVSMPQSEISFVKIYRVIFLSGFNIELNPSCENAMKFLDYFREKIER